MTRIRTLFAGCAVAAVVSLGATAANAVTLVNGSFEMGPDPGVFTTLGNGSTAITGWVVGGLGIDYIGTYWEPDDGERSIDLSGNDKGSISQLLTGLTVGQIYQIKFSLAGNPDGGGATKVAVASDGGSQSQVFTFLQPGNTRADMGWTQQMFSFTAIDTMANLTFSATENNPFGPALDNVSIVGGGVPEPTTWAMMILGLGGAGGMLRLSRRRQARAMTA